MVALLAITLIGMQTSCIPFINGLRASRNNQAPPRIPGQPQMPDKPAPDQPHEKVLAAVIDPRSKADGVEKEVNDLLAAKKFEAIEKMANEARDKKVRLPGGYWKLDSVYNGLTQFYADYQAQEISDEMWQNRLELLRRWKESAPRSITARVALAEAYIEYGWFARGSGYMNTVSSENRALLAQRIELAKNELAEARKMDIYCPRLYRERLYLGMTEGAPLEEFNQLFDEAVAREPNYLQAYLVKSENLTPKWNGENGDWQRFVDSLPGKLATLDTDEADIIYSIVVVNKLREQSLHVNWAMISSDRLKKGFDDLEKKYGSDNLRLNQFAFAFILTNDTDAAKPIFKRIGDDYNREIWGEQTFKQMREVAEKGFPPKPPGFTPPRPNV